MICKLAIAIKSLLPIVIMIKQSVSIHKKNNNTAQQNENIKKCIDTIDKKLQK